MRKLNSLFLIFSLIFSGAFYAQEPIWELAQPKYETSDAFVIGINVMDRGADPTGTVDQTKLFQSLLDILGSRSNGRVNNDKGEKIGAEANRNGGVLFIPEGKYLFKGTLFIPKGVTIRGEWEKPVKGKPIKGTILMAANPLAKGHDAQQLVAYEQQSFIIMQPSSAVMDVAIWYSEQNANNIAAYPPAILFGQQGYWGNDYTLASNITLVNAYDGVIFSRRSGGGAPNCYGIYGTPLRRGIEIDNIAEVGRIDNVDFSPDYWSGFGLPNSPSVGGAHEKYIAENGTAVVMRRNDWSFINKVKAEGYNIGYRLDLSYNKDGNGNYTAPNGHNYGMEFTDCKYGVYVAAVAGAGMMFYEYKFTDCDYGFYLEGTPGGIIQLQGCEFNTKVASLFAPSVNNNTKIIMNQCTINKGAVDVRGGLVSIVGCDFNNESDQIIIGEKARGIITGNRFEKEINIKDVSMYETIIDHTPIEMTKLPHFPYKNQYEFNQKPSGKAYYLATDNGVSIESDDNSDALQLLLNKAKADGGGLVFLPPGRYKFRKPITIPTGVELKGAVDVPSVPTGPGTAIEIYAGKNDENGTPFITMEKGSGLRGLVMNYPEQLVQLLTESGLNQLDVYKYPYTIRGNADVYIVNVGFRACYHGIDLFTNKCDNHFVDYPAGHVFKTGIKVGGGSKGGHIYNAQFNQIAYGSGGETKFGAWPNSPDNDQVDKDKYSREHTAAYGYCWNNLDFIVLEDCDDQVLYNNFDFGSNRGFVLSANNGKGANGICLGQGIDQGMKAFCIEAVGDKGFNFINTQIVTTQGNDGVLSNYKTNNRYLQTDAAFDGKVTFFGVDFWGQPQRIANEILGGTLEMQAGNYENPGVGTHTSVSSNAAFELIGTNINSTSSLLAAGSEAHYFIQSSFVNTQNVNTSACGLWLNNLGHTGEVSPNGGAFLNRTGWIATASVSNADAMNSLDSDNSTRWSTLSERQKPGQWFKVDMLEERNITGVYMESGGVNYNPRSFNVYISSDDETWELVSSGSMNTSQAMFAETQKARFIKIEQTGTSSNTWRIAEFYALNTALETGIETIGSLNANDIQIWYSNGSLNIKGTEGISTLTVYDITAKQILSAISIESSVPVNLNPGMYLVIIENKGTIYRKKIMF